jgi:hypothetical protein
MIGRWASRRLRSACQLGTYHDLVGLVIDARPIVRPISARTPLGWQPHDSSWQAVPLPLMAPSVVHQVDAATHVYMTALTAARPCSHDHLRPDRRMRDARCEMREKRTKPFLINTA